MLPVTMTTKVNGGENAMPATDNDCNGQGLNRREEFVELYTKVAKQKSPSNEDVERLRKLMVSTPPLWFMTANTMASLRKTLIRKISLGLSRAHILAEADILAK